MTNYQISKPFPPKFLKCILCALNYLIFLGFFPYLTLAFYILGVFLLIKTVLPIALLVVGYEMVIANPCTLMGYLLIGILKVYQQCSRTLELWSGL